MHHPDRFQPQTAPFSQARGTRPIARTEPPPPRPDQAEEVLSKLRATIAALEPSVELLHQACRQAALRIPGVGDVTAKHPLPPKGYAAIEYLVQVVQRGPALARAAQIAIYRFYDAVELASAITEPGLSEPGLAEQLRLKLYYLLHFHVDFKADPVLSQLFPGPQTVAPPPPAARVSPVERQKRLQLLESAIEKAETVYFRYESGLELAGRALEAIEKPPLPLKGIFSPEARQIRLIATGARQDAAVRALLEEAVAAFTGLGTAIYEAREAQDPDRLEAATFAVVRFGQQAAAHPLLRGLVPAASPPDAMSDPARTPGSSR